jgi:hypothetical protein
MNDKPEYPYNADQLAWLHDLETTEEPQCTEHLHSTGTDMAYGFCCLGRACIVLGVQETDDEGPYVEYDGDPQILTEPTIKRLRLRGTNGDFRVPDDGASCLTDMNDKGKSFKQIAAYIRTNPWNVFYDPEDGA